MSAYIIPTIFFIVLILSFFKKQNAYNSFIDGSKNAIDLVIEVFPYLLAVMVAVQLFRESGLAPVLARLLKPILGLIGIPSELTELLIVRPVSGSGALAVLENIYAVYGADSYIGNCASVIYGSSETVFYVSAVYFSATGVKKTKYAIPVSLFATFTGYVIGCALVSLL